MRRLFVGCLICQRGFALAQCLIKTDEIIFELQLLAKLYGK
jgi:hypothetical protein